jgi:hypothetical protein
MRHLFRSEDRESYWSGVPNLEIKINILVVVEITILALLRGGDGRLLCTKLGLWFVPCDANLFLAKLPAGLSEHLVRAIN